MKLPECRYLHGFLAFPLPDFYRMCYNEYTKSIGVHMNNREIVSCFFINGYTLQNYDFRFIKALFEYRTAFIRGSPAHKALISA